LWQRSPVSISFRLRVPRLPTRPGTKCFSYPPPELIALIVDHNHGDTAAIVSHAFLPLAQAHKFKNIELRFRFKGNIGSMCAPFPPDPCGVLSHDRKLSITYSSIFIVPSVLVSSISISKCLDHFFTFPHFSRTYFSSRAYFTYLYFILFSELL